MKQEDDKFSEAETVRRREAAIKKMLATPPKPHAAKAKKKKPSRGARTKKKPRPAGEKAGRG